MLRTKCFSIGIRAAMLAIIMMIFLPVNSFAQRRWVVERSRRSRIMVYQPRPYVVYQRRPYYTYRTYSYNNQPYYSYDYQPYYSYRYSQPYAANRYTYSWANPTYHYDDRYNDGWRYRRQRHNRVRIWWR
jgi:hypothetical protein